MVNIRPLNPIIELLKRGLQISDLEARAMIVALKKGTIKKGSSKPMSPRGMGPRARDPRYRSSMAENLGLGDPRTAEAAKLFEKLMIKDVNQGFIKKGLKGAARKKAVKGDLIDYPVGPLGSLEIDTLENALRMLLK